MQHRRTTPFLIALFGVSGLLHFLRPRPFVAIVPRRLPAKRELVYASGAAELVCAGMLIAPATRAVGGVAAAALLVAVFPANVSAALRSRGKPAWYRVALWVRLPLQIPLVVWALQAAADRSAPVIGNIG